jgi:hypothetical protein
MRESDDYLLYVLSAWREMSWSSFRSAYDALYVLCMSYSCDRPQQARFVRWRALRSLEWLGHAESVFDERRSTVYAAPPVLARLPVAGFPTAVLCGARSPHTIAALYDACAKHGCILSLEQQAGSSHFTPRRVSVEAETEADLGKLARDLQVTAEPVPPAQTLLEYAGSVEDYLRGCRPKPGPEIDWPRLDFDTSSLRFQSAGRVDSGARLSKYVHPTRQTSVYYLWYGTTYEQVDGDWGRYAVLRQAGRSVLAYDSRRFLLAAPASAPLPRLLARACALSSGYAPLYTGRPTSSTGPSIRGYDLFRDVPPEIATGIADKVGQKLSPLTVERFEEE